MTLVPLAAALLTAAAGWGVVAPFLRSREWTLEKLADPLEDQRLSLLRSLRELDTERASGSLIEADYLALRKETELQAVAVLRQLRSRAASAELAAAIRPSRRRPKRTVASAPVRSGLLPGVLVAAGIAAATASVLAATLTQREPGGLITGEVPRAAAATAEALTFFEQRVQAHPEDINARLDLAQRFVDAGQVQQATEQYLAVVQIDPKNLEAHTRLGLLLFAAGLSEQGLKAVDRALQIDPTYPQALYARGVILLKGLHRPVDAGTALRAYLNAAPFGSHRVEAEQLLQQATGGGS